MKKSPQDHLKKILKGQLDPAMNFNQKVWALTARIPKGQVTTYAAIARALNSKAYRAVGQALHNNPYAPKVPCHRVVGSNGKLTGFAQGLERKQQMLEGEGVTISKGKVPLNDTGIYEPA